MSKKFFFICCLSAALCLMASAVMAETLGYHKDSGDTNPCRVCHNSAQADPKLRGWAGSTDGPTSGTWGSKPISALCYMCHESGGGPMTGKGHDMTTAAYLDSAHSYSTADVARTPHGASDTIMGGSRLPYVAKAELECTSCHNVHVSTTQPFLQRTGYQELCSSCHSGRLGNGSNGATTHRLVTSATSAGGRDRWSTHPTRRGMGTDINAVNLKATGAMESSMKVAINAAPNYSLGGHLSSGATGNIDCMTCHAVHGVCTATGDYNPNGDQYLAIDNASGGGTFASALCEGCHYGGLAGQQVGTQGTSSTISYSDHPIDSLIGTDFYPTGVDFPTYWNAANAAPNYDRGHQSWYDNSGNNGPTCVSCHDTHGGIANTSILRGPSATLVGATTWIFDYDEWCFVCHSASQVIPNNHHSVINNVWNGTTQIADSALSCGSCHGVSGQTDWKAHNGFWAFETAISSTNSDFCEACHQPYDPTALKASGLKGVNYSAVTAFPASHGTDRGTGAGSSHEVNSTRDGTNNTLSDLTAADFSSWSGGTAEQGTGNAVLCESCHNILVNGLTGAQGLSQGWKANLLLGLYEDDRSGSTASVESQANSRGTATDFYTDSALSAGATGVGFCRGCHQYTGSTSGVDGTFVHNPAAHTVTGYTFPAADAPYGRTTTNVMTIVPAYPTSCPEASTADMSGSPLALSYPSVNAVNCDSCHRPHNADADSYDTPVGEKYRILEVTDTNYGTTPCAQCHNTDVQCQ